MQRQRSAISPNWRWRVGPETRVLMTCRREESGQRAGTSVGPPSLGRRQVIEIGDRGLDRNRPGLAPSPGRWRPRRRARSQPSPARRLGARPSRCASCRTTPVASSRLPASPPTRSYRRAYSSGHLRGCLAVLVRSMALADWLERALKRGCLVQRSRVGGVAALPAEREASPRFPSPVHRQEEPVLTFLPAGAMPGRTSARLGLTRKARR